MAEGENYKFESVYLFSKVNYLASEFRVLGKKVNSLGIEKKKKKKKKKKKPCHWYLYPYCSQTKKKKKM